MPFSSALQRTFGNIWSGFLIVTTGEFYYLLVRRGPECCQTLYNAQDCPAQQKIIFLHISIVQGQESLKQSHQIFKFENIDFELDFRSLYQEQNQRIHLKTISANFIFLFLLFTFELC
jgi:hypothetical protein